MKRPRYIFRLFWRQFNRLILAPTRWLIEGHQSIALLKIMTMVIGMQGFIAFTLWLAPTPDINIVAPFVATLVSISCAAGLSALASSILQEPDLDPQAAAGRIALVIGLIILVHAPVYAIVGIMKNNEPVHDIFEALYFSIVTWTTLGYGDYSPANGVKFTAAFEALMGYVGMAVIIGLIVGRVVNEREQ